MYCFCVPKSLYQIMQLRKAFLFCRINLMLCIIFCVFPVTGNAVQSQRLIRGFSITLSCQMCQATNVERQNPKETRIPRKTSHKERETPHKTKDMTSPPITHQSMNQLKQVSNSIKFFIINMFIPHKNHIKITQ